MAMASFVLGLLGLCVPVLGPVALILGILAARRPLRRGLAIAGIVLGTLESVALVALIWAVIGAWPARMIPKPVEITPPDYDSLIGEGLQGSGFHFSWGGRVYLGSSLHQFDGTTPAKMLTADLEQIDVLARVHTQNDVQVLTFEPGPLASVPPLRYAGRATLERGDPVLILCGDEPIVAHITVTLDESGGQVFCRLADRAADLRGCSGSAVISGLTGDVVGVLLTDSFLGAGFEVLDLPEGLRGAEDVSVEGGAE